jgi:predicted TIM-barrel fold metal-dependent hydrolase
MTTVAERSSTGQEKRVRTIDADAHVVETEQTWEYMDPSDLKYQPILAGPRNGDSNRLYWIIDGKVKGLGRPVLTAQQAEDQARLEKLSATTGREITTPIAARQMENIDVRLKHMDQVGVDIQVLYPSIFIMQVTERPETDVAVCKSYNRWMADVTKDSGGRLRWVAAPPVLAMDEAIKEIRWAAGQGACGVNMRPLETNRTLTDPYFYPLYEEAERLNLPITIHIGNSNPAMIEFLNSRSPGGSSFVSLRMATVGAFHTLIMSEVPSMFPKLRWAFVEASSQWIPYAIHDLRRRFTGTTSGKNRQLSPTVMADNRFYVTCQTDDDLPYILKYSGNGQLMLGTDYGHTDQSSEVEAFMNMREKGEIPEDALDGIMGLNAAACYGL